MRAGARLLHDSLLSSYQRPVLSPPFPFDLPMAGADAALQPRRGDSRPPLMRQVRGATQVETPVDHTESSSYLITAAANMQTPEKLD